MASLNGDSYQLTAAELQAVRDEINNDPLGKGYAGKTTGGIVKLLNEKQLVDNPDPQGEVNGPELTPGEIIEGANLTLDEIKTIKADVDGAEIWSTFFGLSSINLNSLTANEFLNILAPYDAATNPNGKGLLSQSKVDTVKALGKIPDPDWTAQIEEQSRAEELLQTGIVLEGLDIEAAQAL